MTGPVLGIVCGMAAEVRALGPFAADPRVSVAVSGAHPDRAEAEARRLVAAGTRVLLSWGLAGALDPALAPGALILPDRVVGPDGRIFALRPDLARSPAPSSRTDAGAGVPPPCKGEGQEGDLPRAGAAALLAGTDAILLDPAAKGALARQTAAIAVDMETHRVAAVAAEAGLPALAIRAVSDPADRALPRLAAAALDARGRPRMAAILLGLARRPPDLPALISAGRDSRAALAALRAAAGATLGPLLAALEAPTAR